MVSANKIEILRIAETVAQEKMIDKEIVLSALEEAIVKAAKTSYGEENEVIAEINPENGEILLSRKLLVVKDVKNKDIFFHKMDHEELKTTDQLYGISSYQRKAINRNAKIYKVEIFK